MSSTAARNEQGRRIPPALRRCGLMRVAGCALAMLAAAAMSAGSVSFTTAAFTSASFNPQATGAASITTSNSKAGAAIFSAQNLLPGASAQGTVTIGHGGDAAAAYALSVPSAADVPASPGLSGALSVRVRDVTAVPQTKYDGPLSALGTVALGQFEPGESRVFELTVTMDVTATDPARQGAGSTLTFAWSASS